MNSECECRQEYPSVQMRIHFSCHLAFDHGLTHYAQVTQRRRKFFRRIEEKDFVPYCEAGRRTDGDAQVHTGEAGMGAV